MTSDRADIQGDELPPGSILCAGQYTIDRYLSAGGFGVTYLARDSLGRRVVIKECFPSALCFRANKTTVRVRSQGNALEFETILELFEKEARALASLQHPYIVGVHQYFRDNQTAYMAMDFVEGRTLLDIIENDPGRLTPEVINSLLMQMLQAVAFIHRHDILHRDISPDNILIDDDNLPVLIDFGAAREDATRVSRVLSKIQTVKDGYSPQEFYLAGSDHVYASDLYALAATFYHVLTGKAPASSHSRMAAAVRDAADPMKPLGRIDGFEKVFTGAIEKCLGLFPKDRLPTADAWQEAINEDLRKQRLMKLAEMDRNLDQKVRRLVKDFFKDFEPIKSGAKNAPDGPADATSISHKGKSAGEVKPTGFAPDWAYSDGPGVDDGLSRMSMDDLDDALDDAAFPPQPKRVRPAPPEPEPQLLPIDRIKLKYEKPKAPEPEPQPETSPAAIISGWFSRLARPAPASGKSEGKNDKKEKTG